MPNWCNNTLELQHEDPAMIERAKAAMIRGEFLHEFIPVPKELSDTVSGFMGEDQRAAHEAQQAANLEKYGYANWYDFCVNQWGTKWDVGGGDYGTPTITEDGKMIAGFDSAWSPPTTAMERLIEMGFGVKLYYFEPGMAFAGIWEDGCDDYYEYGGMSSDEVAETLPVELNEMFCISDDIAQWEAENAEDEENINIDLDGGLSATNE
jgi:hypothetical protein